jgi:hypothetical protein
LDLDTAGAESRHFGQAGRVNASGAPGDTTDVSDK